MSFADLVTLAPNFALTANPSRYRNLLHRQDQAKMSDEFEDLDDCKQAKVASKQRKSSSKAGGQILVLSASTKDGLDDLPLSPQTFTFFSYEEKEPPSPRSLTMYAKKIQPADPEQVRYLCLKSAKDNPLDLVPRKWLKALNMYLTKGLEEAR
ncbi:hypothetical protein H0H93_005555 [Arthromyces matolae]|nr:hypothetical protein H0H93_005555 [Arthromyces matolae]